MAYTTINKPSDYFNTKLYTGNGSTNAITGVGFQPDFTWIKNRTGTNWHTLYDAIRGTTKVLNSNETGAESTDTTGLTSFDSDGFTHGSGGNGNVNGGSFASWNWLASNTTASNTDGSITSTVSANTTSGFSIVKYTGTGAIATVGHGLGVTPKMIIAKGLGVVNNWIVYHSTLGSNKGLALQDSGVGFTGSHLWNDTNPTSSVFSLGAVGATNTSGQENIAYCFAEKKGYSKFGSYVGNGNADGTFVYTGFKPAWLMAFHTTAGNENWMLVDNKRQGYNPENELLFADLSNAESTVNRIDLFSNGFKATDSDKGVNASGNNYIYMAFAENPFTSSAGTPVMAR